MSELLPCPFCGGEAELHDGVVIIPVIDESGAYIDADVEDTPAWVECAACGAATDGVDSADEAIAAWNRRAQPDNTPLTLDELRWMDGEPVWVQFRELGMYALIAYHADPDGDDGDDVYVVTNNLGGRSPVNEVFAQGGDLYRRKPKREGGA